MLSIGDVVGDRYEVLKEIGRGGMSVIYLAMDNRLNKSLVIKDIRKRDTSHNEILINSLVVEANMLKRLDHGALPKIYDIIDSEGDIYVVMDYIEGESLKEKLDRERVLPAQDVVKWAIQLAEVLDYLHTRKPHPIIYRDMKPDNIMLTPDGNIKLIDFGIAREYKIENTSDTTNLGTKAYAAPEQISGMQTDERTDIYSLGVTLYHLVTGKSLSEPPFEVRPIRTWNASLPEGLEHIIDKCTQLEPESRYSNCKELLSDLINIDKLTMSYKKLLYKKLSAFLAPVLLTIILIFTTAFGYSGIKKENFQDYMNLVNEAGIALINGEETKSISLLENAIQINSKRPDAYINLIDIYINRNESDTGLAKVEAYMNNKYGNIHKNNELLFKVGMTYFDIKKDYNGALNYFRQVDEVEIEDVIYYKSLATTMSSLNINYDDFAKNLIEFEDYNDSLPNDYKKVENYMALINIFISYKAQISDANTIAIRLIEKAQNTLNIINDEQLNTLYELNLEYKLAQAYYSRGVNSMDKLSSNEDYNEAITHYQNILLEDVANAEEIMITIGIIYREMEMYEQAERQFKELLNQYPNSIKGHVTLVNLFIDIEQEKLENKRNYSKVKKAYQEARKVDEIEHDDGFKKLENRLANVNIRLNEGD